MSLALKLVLSPLLAAQAIRTRRLAPVLPEAAGLREGQLGHGGAALRVLIAGDSSAAGVGVVHQDDAFAGYFTRALHRRTGRPVRWRLVAHSGYTTLQVHELLRATRLPVVDIAIVLSGVNDVIGLISPKRAVQHRAALADWLLHDGRTRAVLFGPLPPIDQFPLLPEPLRSFMAADARLHDAEMAAWAAKRRNVFHTPIDLQLSPRAMASDGFHPAEPVYRACGEALARFVAEKMMIPSQETRR
ncbi:MAG TPA: SGNH/GDSL hydrolase family protein [Burkholderiaceae bacterium]|nr:SGNH/GDSL hydrolase family protein [Burkholderiaceae bacterium]